MYKKRSKTNGVCLFSTPLTWVSPVLSSLGLLCLWTVPSTTGWLPTSTISQDNPPQPCLETKLIKIITKSKQYLTLTLFMVGSTHNDFVCMYIYSTCLGRDMWVRRPVRVIGCYQVSLRCRLSLNLELTNWLHWLARNIGITLSVYPALGLQALTTVLSLCVWWGTEDPSSGPQACTHTLHQSRHCPSLSCHILS